MQEFEEDYYAVLGVEESASQEEIRKAYLALAKKLHPDRFPNDPEKRLVAQSEFAKVSRAHDVVSDAERRAEYDAVRLLTRKRHSQNNLSAISPDTLEDGDGLQIDTPLSSTGNFQIPGNETEEENINIKWANKHLSRADDLFRRRNYKEAETALKEAIRLVPTDPRYHNKLAEVYLARGWKTLAMTEVQSALRNDPKNAEAKNLEAKVKALAREKAQTQQMQRPKKSFFEQLKEILTRKL
ncbi:MAG TPA: tetratricopeptide repeat protein [Candidatus Melainabacteria bacterium]|jgi:curved DNA-binding protein CbpA|nr:tetratricopeptide repeat protein [Candidatus Melainabacteria bacterium]